MTDALHRMSDEQLFTALEAIAAESDRAAIAFPRFPRLRALYMGRANALRSAAARLRELGADAARLDWLEGEKAAIVGADSDGADPYIQCYAWGIYGQCETVREAIDAASQACKTAGATEST